MKNTLFSMLQGEESYVEIETAIQTEMALQEMASQEMTPQDMTLKTLSLRRWSLNG